MTERDVAKRDLLIALGACFAEALPLPWSHEAVPQDGYEVWRLAFGRDPSPEALTAVSAGDLVALAEAADAHLEAGGAVTTAHMREWVAATLARWPAEGG